METALKFGGAPGREGHRPVGKGRDAGAARDGARQQGLHDHRRQLGRPADRGQGEDSRQVLIDWASRERQRPEMGAAIAPRPGRSRSRLARTRNRSGIDEALALDDGGRARAGRVRPPRRRPPRPAKSPLGWIPATAPLVIHANGPEALRDHVVAFLKNAVPDQADRVRKAVDDFLKTAPTAASCAAWPRTAPIFVVLTELPNRKRSAPADRRRKWPSSPPSRATPSSATTSSPTTKRRA